MNTVLVIGVIIAFLSAILTAGYDDKQGTSEKK